ncbi:unnamed protein product [Calypogeia fissa]
MALAMDDPWRKALVAEDCRQVRKLLEQPGGKSLLKSVLAMKGQSWDKRRDHEVDGEARTALHVAARRGDLKLMQDILNMGSDEARDSAGRHSGECPDSSNCYLLKFVDPQYALDALAMAVVNGNCEIVNLLRKAILGCQSSFPYNISNNHAGGKNQGGDNAAGQTIYAESDVESDDLFPNREYISELSRRTNEFLKEKSESSENLEKLYYQDCDFNFLPISVYLFHFTFSESLPIGVEVIPARERIISKASPKPEEVCSSKLARYLLSDLLDGQGRTLLHVAVDSQKVEEVLAIIPTDGSKNVDNKADDASRAPLAILTAKVREDILNKTDGAGRTPLFRAAAKGKLQAVNLLLKNLANIVVAEKVKYPANKWGDLDMDELSRRNHFPSSCVYFEKETEQNLLNVSSSALHVAIIHKQADIVKALLSHDRDPARKKDDEFLSHTDCFRLCPWPELPGVSPGKPKDRFSSMQLAVLVENISIVQELEKDSQLKQRVQKGDVNFGTMEGAPDSFLLSAAMGNPEVIKAFLDEGRDPLVTDRDRNTALHYAMEGKPVQFHPHMVDFVGCDHVSSWRRKTAPSASVASHKTTEKNYAHTTGSIHLLLRAGINIWSYNKDRRTAYPTADAPEEFAKWWYEKEEKQAQADLKNLNGAANAISVTAALVATASYLGPFQPPLGYGADSVQAEIMAVKIFVVCNSVSFYFALAAIMYALLPSTLPIIQESTSTALVKTRLLVAIALAFLLPSIICVLSAFAASYIAVIPDRGAAHQGLAVITTIAAGFFCLIAIIRFAVRYLNILVTLDLKDLNLAMKEIVGLEELRSITQKHKNK